MLVGQDPGDVGEQPGPVERLDLDRRPGRPRTAVGAHSTSMIRSGCAGSESTLTQSLRCTETPLPRVTKPMIGSPGHRRAAAGQLDPDVVDALDDDARVAVARGACGRAAVGGDGLGDVLGGAPPRRRATATRRCTTAARRHGPRRSRRTARRCRGSAARAASVTSESPAGSAGAAGPACASPGRWRPCPARSPPRGAPWRTSADLVAGPRRT